jgi:hypothetical protein
MSENYALYKQNKKQADKKMQQHYSGIGYLQKTHELSRSKFPPDTAFLLALAKYFHHFLV